MYRVMTKYQVNKKFVAEFERAYLAGGAFGRMFVGHGSKSYALYRSKSTPQLYVATHTWLDEADFNRALDEAAQESYAFQNQSRNWINEVHTMNEAEMAALLARADEEYDLLSEA
jgi:hypothetical protein